MPGNEAEDRVHNFFPQVDLSSSHHHPQAADGSWQGLGSNLWPGSQREISLLSSNSKGYNIQQSGNDRGQNSHSFQIADGLTYGQPAPSPVLAKSQSQSQFSNSNGYTHDYQTVQIRQNQANFMGVGAGSDQYPMTSRGLSTYESHGQSDLENNVGSVRTESSKSQTFGFLGGQEQMSRQHMGMFQTPPQQLPGFNDMQLMQQQVMLRRMEELQMKQHEARHNNSINQNPSIIDGTPISPFMTASNNAWPTELSAGNKSWLHRATQATQGLPNDLRFTPERGQALSLNQSTNRHPASNTRDSPSGYSHVSPDNHQIQQMATYNNFSPGDQYRGPMDQVNVEDGSLSSRYAFQEGKFFDQPSGQGLTRGGMYLGTSQPVNSLQKDLPMQEFGGPSGKMGDKSVFPVSSPENAVALDPTEEKILFGNGDIWDSFGDSADVGAAGGSWSALMQSAVAETSSNNAGLQEERAGPSNQNSEVAVGPLSNDVDMKSFQGIQRFQQSVSKSPYNHANKLQMGFNQGLFQQSSEERSNFQSRDPQQKPLAEGTQSYHNTTHSSDAKSRPGSDAAQQMVPSHISGQVYGKPNGHNDTSTPSSSRNELSGFYGNEGRLPRSDSDDQKRMFHGEMSQGGHTWKMVSNPQSTGGLEQVRMGIGSPQVNRGELNLNNSSGRLNSSTSRESDGTNPNYNNLNFWKQAEPSNFIGENKHNLNKASLFPEFSMNGFGNNVVNMHKKHSEGRENSSESHHSNTSLHANDKFRLDGGDAKNLLGEKQKGPGQGFQNVSGPRKFQYHPMENLNENTESLFRKKNVSNNQSQQSSIFGQYPKASSEMGKGHLFRAQQNEKGSADSPSRVPLAGFARSNSPLSQNVPEFLHNMDQSKENNNSDGSIGTVQQSQSRSSQDFGLQLGFQSFSTQSHALSHSSVQVAGSPSSAHTMHEMREKDNTSQFEPFHSFNGTSQGEPWRKEISGTSPSPNDVTQSSTLGNFNAAPISGFSFSRGQRQGEQVIGMADRPSPPSSQIRINQKDRLLLSGDTSKLSESAPTPDEVKTHENPMERVHNAWTKPPNQQNLFGGLSQNKVPPGMFRPGQLNNNAASASGKGQQAKGGLHQPGSSVDLPPKPSASQGKESVLRNQSGASPLNSTSTERDFEAFGHSLQPNNHLRQNYSLLNQMKALQSTVRDPSNRGLKRFKGEESNLSSQIRQSSEQRIIVGDTKTRAFSGSASPVDNANPSSVPANLPPDVHASSRMDSSYHPCSSSTSALRLERSQISPQMAPSWFEQYGTFKNGQMFPVSEARKYSALKAVEKQLPLGRSSDTSCANNTMAQTKSVTNSFQADNAWQKSTPTSITPESLPSEKLMAHDFIDKGSIVAKPKKPKSVVPLPSWHKEVMQGSEDHLTKSMAEEDWARAANRLVEKVEDKVETSEDGPPRLRSKRRLASTTELMQQLFRPPESGILSSDASSNSEAVACTVARLALRDACSLMSCSKSDSGEPLESINSLTDKHKTTGSQRIGNQHLSEVTQNFFARAKKLESEFVRLDKSTSLIDSRLEDQEHEKVSVINRFAKFHGPATLAPAGFQRYVTPLPMPRDLPERLPCLSL